MSTPQDGPNRKKQKASARRKLAVWRAKKEETGATTGAAKAAPAKKAVAAKAVVKKPVAAKTAAAK